MPDALRRPLRALLALFLLAGILHSLPLRAADGAAAAKEERRKRVEAASSVKKYPYRSWDDAFVYESNFYEVRTNTSKEVASYIGQLMDFAHKHYCRIFGYEGSVPKMAVYAYRTMKEYDKVAVEVGLKGSAGLFRKEGGTSTIHLPYEQLRPDMSPTNVLLHEGTHQFVSVALDFPVPERYRRHFVDGTATLSSVPLWLNEGIAVYMEASYYDGDGLAVGEINRPRLLQLQQEIRRQSSVPLRELFTAPQNVFGPSHYAAAWGVVYWFLHDADAESRALKRRIFSDYIAACRTGFLEDPEKDFADFLKPDFNERWIRHVQEAGLRVLTEKTVGERGSFERWEARWKEWILALDPNDPYGGLLAGTE